MESGLHLEVFWVLNSKESFVESRLFLMWINPLEEWFLLKEFQTSSYGFLSSLKICQVFVLDVDVWDMIYVSDLRFQLK